MEKPTKNENSLNIHRIFNFRLFHKKENELEVRNITLTETILSLSGIWNVHSGYSSVTVIVSCDKYG